MVGLHDELKTSDRVECVTERKTANEIKREVHGPSADLHQSSLER